MADTSYGVGPLSGKSGILNEMIGQADFIFQGSVERIRYRLSDAHSKEHIRLPHTFVTFRVDKMLKGQTNRGAITLRFIGGADRERGDFLTVSGVPWFNFGNQSILLVKGNGEAKCPLVNCSFGRFQVFREMVYSNEGREVFITEEGVIALGKYGPVEKMEILETPIFGAPLSREDRELLRQVLEEMPQELKESLGKGITSTGAVGPVLRIERSVMER